MPTAEDRIRALTELGLEQGDTVMVHCSLRNVGPISDIPTSDRQAFLKALLNIFDKVLDLEHNGTLVVPTFSYSYARNKVAFHYETTPADPVLGIFAEFVRCQPNALRSMHPLFSLTGLGYGRDFICANVGKSSYGWNSPFDRLYRADAKLLLLGVDFSAMTFVHHIEHMAGVSHFYHKAFFIPAYKDGEELPLPYMSFVRRLNGKVEIYTKRLQDHMISNGFVSLGKLGGAPTMLVSARDVFNEGFLLLQENPCLLIKDPYYVTD